MKNICNWTVMILILSISNAYGQINFSFDPDKVTQYEMSMTEYEADKEAEALMIYEHGKFYFSFDDNHGFELIMEFSTKIKILKQSGINYADFEIDYYGDRDSWEEVYDIEGTTFNYDGNNLKKTELKRSSVFENKYENNSRSKKFTMPDVKEGSIIEVKYKIRTPFFSRMREWEFQKKIPVVSSKLIYRAIPFYTYTYILTGATKFDDFKSEQHGYEMNLRGAKYKEMAYTFGMNNLPAFRDEEFMTSPKDYMVRLNMQLSQVVRIDGAAKDIMTTWPEMCDEFLKSPYFGKYINSVEKEARKIIPTLNLEGKSNLDKIKIISDYVKSIYTWNGYYGKFIQVDKLSDFMKQKRGNIANINLFLIGLLRAADIDVNPVILSTRGHGLISKQHPFESFFNYVIAGVNNGDNISFIDATESLLPYNELPARCMNVEGLIIRPKKMESWTFIGQGTQATTTKNFNIHIDPINSTQNIEVVYHSYGNDAFMYRSQYTKDKNDLMPFFKKVYNIDTKDGVNVENYTDRNKAFVFDFKFDQPLEGTGDKIFIKPFCDLSIKENPFKMNKRTLAIDLVFIEGAKYKSIINIPDGYVVDYIPKATNSKSQIMSINYNAKVEGNTIIIDAGYEMSKNIFPASDYFRLKMTYAAAIEKFSDMIVLVKK